MFLPTPVLAPLLLSVVPTRHFLTLFSARALSLNGAVASDRPTGQLGDISIAGIAYHFPLGPSVCSAHHSHMNRLRQLGFGLAGRSDRKSTLGTGLRRRSAAITALSSDDKASMDSATAWSASAEAYALNFNIRADSKVPQVDMGVGRKMVVARVKAALADKEHPVVLDVAAAGGEPALSMAKEIPHGVIHGTDFAPGMVDVIRKRGEEAGLSNLRSSVADGTSLSGFTDDSVDALTCTWGLESMPDQKMAIGEFYRVSKPGGTVVVGVWDKDPNSIAKKVFNVIKVIKGQGSSFDMDIQPLGGDDGVKVMEDAGFIGVTAEKVDIPFYAPPNFGPREFFPYMVKPTPIEAAFSMMEEGGRPDVRNEAAAIFEKQILEDTEKGCAPPGPGFSPPDGDSASENVSRVVYYQKALLIQGRKPE